MGVRPGRVHGGRWPGRPWRTVAAVGLVAVVLVAAGGCARPSTELAEPPAGGTPVVTPSAPSPTPATVQPSAAGVAGLAAAPSASASARSSTSRPPAPKPSRRPTQVPLPPAPPAPRPSSNDHPCPTFEGAAAPMGSVRSTLDAASSRHWWVGVSGAPTGATDIVVPKDLLHAVAFMESTWRSNVVACDGGMGTMQLMAGTVSFTNQRFGTSYDVHTLSGNVDLGAQYLAWLIAYFGSVWFANSYDLGDEQLLNAVIAAYNVGPGAVEQGDKLVIPNPSYVQKVRGYLSSCPCDAF